MIFEKFDNWEFKQALSLLSIDPFTAKNEFEEYIKKYPNDYFALPYYASILITIGEFEKAEKIIEYIENIANSDKHLNNNRSKVESLTGSIILTKVRLLSYQEKYDELYQLFSNNIQKNITRNINNVDFYCKSKLDKLEKNMRNKHPYIFRQIVNYEESDFLLHIQKHIADYNQNVDKPNKNIFAPTFPIEKVLEEIKKYIPSDKKIYPGFYEDLYAFKYDSCGRENNKIVDFFKVICFHNTQELITMLPTSDGQYLPYIDLNYLIEDNKKIKKLSQIDKFNRRYNR